MAARLLVEQRERFDGVRKAAYLAAGVNPATWARATAGDRVRPDRLVMIVKSLWPESRGNWDLVPDPPTSNWRPSNYSGPTWVADVDEPWVRGQVQLKNYVDEVVIDVDERLTGQVEELEERVRELERMLLEVVDPEGGDEGDDRGTPATRKPDSGPDTPSPADLRVLPTAASKTKTTPSVNKRRQRQDDAAEASQDDGDFEPR